MDGQLITQETRLPFGSLVPALWSAQAGDELVASKLQHTIDLVFDFNVNDAAAMPSGTTNWTVLRPRKAGFITAVDIWMVDTGTSGTANTVDVKKNGSTILSSAISISHSDSDHSLKSGTLTTSTGVAFAADDRIEIEAVKGTNNGVGLKVRIRGYYVGA